MAWTGRKGIQPMDRSLRFGGRFRERLYTEDEVEWEGKMSASEAVLTSLRIVTAPSTSQDESKSRRLAYLNALVKMWQNREPDCDDGLRLREVMLCLRIPLVHESTEVRAATLRTIRHLTKTLEDVQSLNDLHIPYLITRCLDIELDNKVERLQVLKLARHLNFVAQGLDFPLMLLRSIVAIAEGGKKEDDRLHRVALALLCEISVINPYLFMDSGGIKALNFCVLDTSMPKIVEVIIASLLRLHNDPELRLKAKVNLGLIVAPYTEFTYIHQHSSALATGDKQDLLEEREKRFKCAEHAFLCTMRSWSGLCQMCQSRQIGPSHLQAVVDILYLNNNEVRLYLINLFYELLNLKPLPNDTTFQEAVLLSDPSTFRDTWKLAEGFVAFEGLDLVPHISKSRPNLIENHMSLTLQCLLKCDLPEALVKVIVGTGDHTLSVRATVLLGELLHLANLILPREVNVISHCLPGLLQEVSSFDPKKATRAQEAVSALQKLHSLKKCGPKANSLFLDQILCHSGLNSGECFVGDRLLWTNFPSKAIHHEDRLKIKIKSSSVNINYDANVWDWDLVTAIFKCPESEALLKNLELAEYKNFVRRVTDYFKPTNGRFCRMELTNQRSRFLARTACYLLDFLIASTSPEADKILEDFVNDIQECLLSLTNAESAHDCLFSPTRIATTGCQYYFLFIGRMSRSEKGRNVLDQCSILGHFTELLAMRSDLYLKLVISCLDYSSMEWGSRTLLSKALREGSETCRMYATRFLGVLIRSKSPNITQWGIDLLTAQLCDTTSKTVPFIALSLLDEAADDKMNLEAMVCSGLQTKDLSALGIRGILLKTRLLASSTYGIKVLNDDSKVEELFKLWSPLYETYVALVEDLINDGFTRHQRDEDLSYGRRRTTEAFSLRPAYVPYHLFSQLASSKSGMEILIKHSEIHDMLSRLHNANDKHWIKIKAAIWGVAHVATSYEGASFVDREGGIESLVRIAETSNVLSLKASAFYALSLVATTRHGCQVLASKGWCTLKYGRDDHWPVLEDWFLRFQMATLIDNKDDTIEEPVEEEQIFPRRSSSLQYTPTEEDARSSGGDSSEIHSRSLSMSSRKRLSNLFKSLSLKKRKPKENGNPEGDESVNNHDGSYNGGNNGGTNTESSGDVIAPIATPEKSRSSSGDTLEEIKEETEAVIIKNNPCATTESSTNSEASIIASKPSSSSTVPRLSPIPSSSSLNRPSIVLETNAIVKPIRMKQRSGQRAFSESEAQAYSHIINTIVPGASVTSMSSTGSYTDNPGYHTLRTIHNRHKPVLDFIETGEEHEVHLNGNHIHHHQYHNDHHNQLKRSDSVTKQRHSSGSTKRKSLKNKKKLIMLPLKEEDLAKTINDRYWGITLPAKLDQLLTDEYSNLLDEINDQVHTPSSPGVFEYHTEEICLKCHSYSDDAKESKKVKHHRSSSLTCSPPRSNLSVIDKDISGTKSSQGSPLNLRKHVMLNNLQNVDSVDHSDVDFFKRRLEQRQEALKVISTLNASVGSNKAEDVLLKMKQQAPYIFKDLCFYSEVCQLMAHFSFRLTSRRFIQELFMDVSFEILEEDARMVLASTATTTTNLSSNNQNEFVETEEKIINNSKINNTEVG